MSNTSPTSALVDECERQIENCTYTATSFIVWLRFLRWVRTAFLVAPVIFGALATWKIVAQGSPVWAAVFALLATVLPPAYRASKLDEAIADYEVLTGEFTNLRDRFRQLATISSHKPFEEFEADAEPYFERLERARARSLAPPDWTFTVFARRKVKAGHYRHDYDRQAAEDGSARHRERRAAEEPSTPA